MYKAVRRNCVPGQPSKPAIKKADRPKPSTEKRLYAYFDVAYVSRYLHFFWELEIQEEEQEQGEHVLFMQCVESLAFSIGTSGRS